MMHSNCLIFDDKKRTILLSVDPSDVNVHALEELAIKEKLSKKKEFHITIVGSQTGLKLEEMDFEEIKKISKKLDWAFSMGKDFFLISKEYPNNEIRRSIIQTVTLPALDIFYKKLSLVINLVLDIPFPHVTLFTDSTEKVNQLKGIGIYSQKDFKEMSPVRIDL